MKQKQTNQRRTTTDYKAFGFFMYVYVCVHGLKKYTGGGGGKCGVLDGFRWLGVVAPRR